MGKSLKKRHPASNAYANALLEIGQERGESEALAEQLAAFATALEENPNLRIFFESPKIKRSDKKAALDRALAGKFGEPVLNMLKLLVDRGRNTLFEEIAHIFGELLDDARGRTQVQVVTTTSISDAARSRLVTLLGDRLGREIIAEESVDPGLLGGMTVRIGDTVIDGSLRTKLKHVRDAMTAPRLGRNLIDEDERG